MKFILIMTIQSSHVDGGISMHSIEFNDEIAACNAGFRWQESMLHERVRVNYIVVESP